MIDEMVEEKHGDEGRRAKEKEESRMALGLGLGRAEKVGS